MSGGQYSPVNNVWGDIIPGGGGDIIHSDNVILLHTCVMVVEIA